MKAGRDPGWLKRLALATKRRFFTLYDDWQVKLDGISYEQDLNASITIPRIDKGGNEIVFDGASIPLPWLVSLLTIGILRPLGVMLIASIVHDYAYKYGHLQKQDGSLIIIERHVADRLFRDIITTLNGLPLSGYIVWFFVRLGWPIVKYDGKPRGGKPPLFEYLFFFLSMSLFLLVGISYSISAIAFWLVVLYGSFYILTILVNKLTSE